MLTPSVQDIKKELAAMPQKELLQLCLQLAKLSKTNKEMLGFLLFNAHDIPGFIAEVNKAIDFEFTKTPGNPYLAKKTIRKIAQILGKYNRYAKNNQVEVETGMNFCKNMNELPFRPNYHPVIENLYGAQLKKIDKALSDMHEDLRYEYQDKVNDLKQKI